MKKKHLILGAILAGILGLFILRPKKEEVAIKTREEIIKIEKEKKLQEDLKEAKKELEETAGMTPFAVSYCFLTALDGHAIPLTAAMLSFLTRSTQASAVSKRLESQMSPRWTSVVQPRSAGKRELVWSSGLGSVGSSSSATLRWSRMPRHQSNRRG